jgi:hypothetical protein
VNQPLAIALRIARHPVNDFERVELGSEIIPSLLPGENVDTGALRLLADRVEWLERECEECRVLLKDVGSGRVDSRLRSEASAAVARLQGEILVLEDSRSSLMMEVDKLRADHKSVVELVEKLIHENCTLRGPVPPIVPGDVEPPAEIIKLAWQLHDWMLANGYRNWRIAGVCDSSQVDRLTAELETERNRLAACGVIALADTPQSAAEARKMHPDYRSASLSDVERRVDECIRLRAELAEARAENGRQAATIAELLYAEVKLEPLRLEVGQTYVRRDGGRETIVRKVGGLHCFQTEHGEGYAENGRFGFFDIEHDEDLVALAPSIAPASPHP